MTKAHDQAVTDEALAEERYQGGLKPKAKAAPKAAARVPRIDLSPLAADEPDPASTGEVQSALMDPETKKTFELLIVEIRRQMGGGNGESGSGGVTQATFDAFKAAVVNDLNSLRDSIMLTQASLDADAGVATDTFVAQGTPPPITAA